MIPVAGSQLVADNLFSITTLGNANAAGAINCLDSWPPHGAPPKPEQTTMHRLQYVALWPAPVTPPALPDFYLPVVNRLIPKRSLFAWASELLLTFLGRGSRRRRSSPPTSSAGLCRNGREMKAFPSSCLLKFALNRLRLSLSTHLPLSSAFVKFFFNLTISGIDCRSVRCILKEGQVALRRRSVSPAQHNSTCRILLIIYRLRH